MTKQSTVYRAFLVSAAFVICVAGQLYGNTLATGGNDFEVDFNDLVKMSDAWLLAADVNEPNEPNEPIISDVNITSAGGHFELPGGLIIDAPAGAVNEPTLFQIRLLEAEEVEPYLDIGQTEKGFLGGFEIISDGLVFNEPISITLPVEPLEDPNSLPYLFFLNKENGTLIPSLPEDTPTPMQRSYSMLEANATAGDYIYDGRYYAAEFLLSFVPQDPYVRSYVLTELYKVFGHNDCEVDPCRCNGRWDIAEGAADLVSTSGCSNFNISGGVTYTDCAGQPTETWNFEENSIQIAVKTDKNSILCEGSITMTVELYDVNDEPPENQEVQVTSSRPDLLEVTSFGGGLFSLERVGKDTGVADVVIDAGCEITRTVHIQVGCEIPDLTGRWSISGSEEFWDCNDVEDNGEYPFSESLEIDSQVGSTFAGSISYEQIYELHEFGFDFRVLETYEEKYHGEITPNNCPEITDRCTYKVSGSTDYTETFLYLDDPDDEPYEIKGITTFSGSYNNSVMTLTSLGFDTKGDTCQTSSSAILRR